MSPLNALWVLLLAWLGPTSGAVWLYDRGWLDGPHSYLLFQTAMIGLLCLGVLALSGRAAFARDLGLRPVRPEHLAWAGLALVLYLPADLSLKVYPLWSSGSAGVGDALRIYVARESPAAVTPVLVLAMAVMAPLAEELGFRGLLQGSLARALDGGPWIPLALPGVLWTLGHLGGPAAYGVASTAVLAVLLGVLRARSGSVLPGIALHAAVNGFWLGVAGWAGAR
ncbi:MAG: CPBP family intramembrane metalloprotease [Chromatiales bacterium]|jgi:membrane protease YdiL (CAAX protease family)